MVKYVYYEMNLCYVSNWEVKQRKIEKLEILLEEKLIYSNYNKIIYDYNDKIFYSENFVYDLKDTMKKFIIKITSEGKEKNSEKLIDLNLIKTNIELLFKEICL